VAAGAFSWHTLGKLQRQEKIGAGAFYSQRFLLLTTTVLFILVL
jgi:hypothetical protein